MPSGLQVGLHRRVPAAVFFAQVFGQIGHVEQLLGVQVGVVVGRQDDVRAGAGVGGHRSLRAHVFPAFVVDANLDAGLLGELLHVGHVGVDVALHEAAPAQHAQLGAFFGFKGQRLRMDCRRPDGAAGAECGGSGDTGRAFKEFTTVELSHCESPSVLNRG